MQPMQPGQSSQPKPTSMGDQMMESPDDAGFTVQIEVKPDGTFMVGSDGDMQPAGDVKTALTMALALIKGRGQAQSQDFNAGYDEMGTR